MPNRSNRLRTGIVAAAVAFAVAAPPVLADEADAKHILQAMSDYLAAQSVLSFDYDSTLEIVTREEQKLGLAASGTVVLARPDKLRATRTGGFADIEMVFDGQTFTLLGKHVGLYARQPIPGSVDHLVDALRDDYGRPLPAADLLTSDSFAALMAEVTDVKDLGSGMIGGQECDHLAFRTDEVDWQIWIAQGNQPYPCRYVITTRSLAQGPQYQIDIRDWRDAGSVAADAFAFVAPDGATEITFQKFSDQVSDLPDHFSNGDKQ